MSAAFIGDLTVSIIFLVVVFSVIGALTTLYFGWEGFKLALVGKAYAAIFKVILVALVIGFAGLMCWYEITTPPVERLVRKPL